MSVRFGDLKRQLLARVGCLERYGTATGGSTTTLVDSVLLTDDDDFFINRYVYIHDGIHQGKERRITDSSASGTSITVSPAFHASTPIDATSKYYIYDTYRNYTVEQAIIDALQFLRRQTLLPIVDESITLGDPALAATYEITMPAGVAAIRKIWMENPTGQYDTLIPGSGDTDSPWWRVIRSTTRKIRLDRAVANNTGWLIKDKKLRIIGQQYQAEPVDDDSTFDINPAPLRLLAAVGLKLQTLNQVDEIQPTRQALVDAMRGIGLGRGFEQGTVIVEEA